MNLHDLDLIIGILTGAAFTGAVATLLWKWRDGAQGTLNINLDDGPFRPLADSDLRLIRVCDSCHRYIGDHRTLTAGQHINILPTTCPRCAKRAAVAAAPKPSVA